MYAINATVLTVQYRHLHSLLIIMSYPPANIFENFRIYLTPGGKIVPLKNNKTIEQSLMQ